MAKKPTQAQREALQALTYDQDTVVVCYFNRPPLITNERGYFHALWASHYLSALPGMAPTRYRINARGRAALEEAQ